MNDIKCKICNKIFKTNRGLSLHIAQSHNLNIKDYYDQYIKLDEDGKCLVCGKETNFKNITYGYFKYCSSKCSANSNDTIEKRKQTKLKIYGNENYVNAEKSSQTWKNKSKEEIDDIVTKRFDTHKEKYGVKFFTNREKFKQTSLDKYGIKYYTNRKKYKDTCIKKYGVENTFQVQEFKDKSKETMLEKYGVEHPSFSDEIKNKTKNTLMNKYGVDSVTKVESVKTKIKEKIFNDTMDKLNIFLKENYDSLELVKYEDYNNIYLKCKKCNSIFKIQKQCLKLRYLNGVDVCFNCNPIHKNFSLKEKKVVEFIKSIYFGEIIENKKVSDYEIDIFIPEYSLGIEFNGLYWHSEVKVENTYHLKKTNMCENEGIHLIHIFEDDWDYKSNIVKSRLLNLLNKSNKIYARECDIKQVSFVDTDDFLNKNHLQGNCVSKYRYGLYFKDELVSLMTFGSLRKNLGSISEEGSYELLRFCNKLNTSVIGGANKLFKYFIDQIDPKKIISYADRSWTMNNDNSLYDKLGFVKDGISKPSYSYVVKDIRLDRFIYRKDILVKEGYDPNLSEHEIMLNRNIYRIYDSGNIRYVWNSSRSITPE